ncbi:MAG: mannose-1-phosphate guanylyltransferase [Deltaproteobacteria bacterium]|nr:mannose-1-phosphate guanylyltransferase [Deltaproteobacteria bacterium]MBW1871367.1 mannose-1-phosphate guanylyltransferase [Deltaproteobacteria bacterium]
MIHALIMAGGSGTRFWPLSREALPKQFLAIGGQQPLLRTTAERILPLCGWDGLWVVASKKHAKHIHRILPELPKKNMIIEPRPRNTAPAIGLGAATIANHDPEGMVVVLPSDHVIRPPAKFRKLIKAACTEAKSGAMVTLGVVPSRPETGFGYIQAGRKMRSVGGFEVFEVDGFTEKPDLPCAIEYLQAGSYYWNSGMFIFSVEAILREIQAHLPQLHRGLKNAMQAKVKNRPAIIKRLFGRIEGVSIDYGVMEKSSSIHVLPCDTFWSDVGSWAALPEVVKKDESGNVIEGDVLSIDSQNCVIHSEKRLVACVGVQDLVVVETPDAVLVCPINEAQQVKRVVQELRRLKRKKVL